ncbi:beta-1,3-glucanase family protein [Streptomyces sp. NBC_01236]|uniref:beta-1,3-glucanase family protein n=1 Tax=Streptomyces sp. NBC_01236 TaxID=2903789 RepID=UPI002E12E6EB|nr:beta-1,3-glucanase family protein [Streptomyces sp. NBC_01236]
MLSRRSLLRASTAALATPAILTGVAGRASATASTLSIDLQNNTGSNTVYAYVTGLAIDNGNAWYLLRADGQTPYYPSSPSSTGTPLAVDCAIPLNASGAGPKRITIPRIAGGRLWFSVDRKLTFLLNPGPALVEPSVTNSSDPNIDIQWDFCEFTFNSSVLYANVSAVDFAAMPIALKLTTGSGGTQSVPGLAAGGLDSICAGLTAQHAADGQGWDQLIVTSGGQNLRALSPTAGIVRNSSLFSGYYSSYVDQVWAKYASTPLTVDTQASWGMLTGTVSGGLLTFPGAGSFAKPSAADIFSCNSGPFNVSSAVMGALTARISAALNRSTLLSDANQPDGENPATYYTTSPTNHYARLVHATSTDGRGYAFPYDDVTPNGGTDQSGFVTAGDPTLLTVTLGAVHGGGGTTPPSGGTSAFFTIQAASYTGQSGTTTETTSDTGGGYDVGYIAGGDWLGYANIDFGSGGATQFIARVASGAASGVSGLVQVALDSPTATPVGSFSLGNTGGWQSWVTIPANISRVTGVHTVYLTFASGQPADFVNIHWFTFAA